MKYRPKRMWRSVVSIVLVLSLVLGSVTTAFAATSSDADENATGRTIKYVSLGDSMTNGYGLDGYEYEYHKGDASKTECTNVDCENKDLHVVHHWSNGYLQEAPDSYPVQVAEEFGWDLTQLAMSAMRAEDLHWVLEADPEDAAKSEFTSGRSFGSWIDDNPEGTWEEYVASGVGFPEEAWLETFSAGDYYTWNEFTNGRMARQLYPGVQISDVVEKYQTAVTEADVISLGIGNGNFGVFMLGRIMESIGFSGSPNEAMIYNVENALSECDPEIKKEVLKLKDELYKQLDAKLADYGLSVYDGGTMEALANTLVYATLSYALNYAGSVEAILQLNPDAEIILVGIMNTFAGMNMTIEGETIPMSALMGVIVEPVNTYIAALPTYMQATGNSVYTDATFYYAEAPEVECMVDTYEDALANGNATVRSRFVTEIVGACDHDTTCTNVNTCDDWDTGMIWGMAGGLIGELDLPGVSSLARLSLDDIEEYEAALNASHKEDCTEECNNPAHSSEAMLANYIGKSMNNADGYSLEKLISIVVYLGFEDAVLAGSKNSTIDIGSFMALADKENLVNVFGPIVKAIKEPNSEITGKNLKTVYDVIAVMSDGMLDADTVEKLYKEEITAELIATAGLKAKLQELDSETLKNLAGIYGTNDPDKLVANFIEDGANNFNLAWNTVYAMAKESAMSQVDEENAHVIATIEADKQKAKLSEYYKQYTDGIADINTAVNNIEMLNLLVSLPELIEDGAQNDPTLKGLLHLFGRMLIGDGLGAHPSPAGHDDLTAAIVKSYSEGYTVQDETIENLKIAAGIAADLVAEYYDEAYAYAYDYAEEKGYIDDAIEALDTVKEELGKLDPAKLGLSEELTAELESGIRNANDTIDQIKKLIKEADELDEASLAELEKLLGELGQNMTDVREILTQAGIDAGNAAWEAYEELKPVVIEKLKEAVAEGTEWLMKKIDEAYDEFVDAAVAAVKEYAPKAADYVYNWLLENPDKVIAFFNEYGDEMVDFIVEYHKEIGAVIGWLAAEYGDEVVDYILENHEEILKTMVEWYDEHGENAWKLIRAYMDELGITDMISGFIDELKDPEKFKALVEEIYKAIETYGPEVMDAVYKYAEENGYLDILEEAIGNIEEGIDKVKEQIAAAEAAYADSTALTYEIGPDSYYVALGDSTSYAVNYNRHTVTPYGDRLAEELGLEDSYINLSKQNMTAEELFTVIEENKAEIEKADLITLSLGNGEMTKNLLKQFRNKVMGLSVDDPDWSKFVDEKGVKDIEKALAEIEEYLLDSMDAETAELMTFALETYAYSYVDLACNYPEAVNAIHKINPDAQVIVVGMYNPLSGTTFTMNDQVLPVGEYVDSIVELTNLHYLAYSVLTDNTVYVDAPDVENNVEAGELTLAAMLRLTLFPKALYPTDNGHEYIKNEILNIMTIKEAVLWGDADSNGEVNVFDAQLILEWIVKNVTDDEIALDVCDVDASGSVDVFDAQMILELVVGNITIFPVEE